MRRSVYHSIRGNVDWATEIEQLLDTHYPEAVRLRLVCDNLNTHGIGSLYKAFPPEQARRLASRLEIHHTPKHGSWLNIAEIELSALTIQCLNRRIPDIETLTEETTQWEQRRNASQKGVDWQFSTQEARIKLKRLYLQIQSGTRDVFQHEPVGLPFRLLTAFPKMDIRSAHELI